MCWEGASCQSSSPGTAAEEEEQSWGSHEGSTNAWGGGGLDREGGPKWQGSKRS